MTPQKKFQRRTHDDLTVRAENIPPYPEFVIFLPGSGRRGASLRSKGRGIAEKHPAVGGRELFPAVSNPERRSPERTAK